MIHAPTTYSTLVGTACAWRRFVPGLVLCIALAGAAMALGDRPWLISHGFSALTVATVLGMAICNILPSAWLTGTSPGIDFAKQTLLRAGIVLYGVKLTLQDIDRVGSDGVLIDVLVLASTFLVAWLVGTRLLRMDRQTTLLIGAGSSICGAAAVLAAEPVVQAGADKVTVAISTVVIFGTMAIFLYPVMYRAGLVGDVFQPGSHAFGVYEGSTIQEVAQVLAAAQGLGPSATDSAVIAKMVRVMMLAPFLIGLSAWLTRNAAARTKTDPRPSRRPAMPWFAFLFVAVVVVNSLMHWTPAAMRAVNEIDLILLAMAMGGVGLTTHAVAIRQAGFRPLLLGAVVWAWLILGGAAINGLVTRWF